MNIKSIKVELSSTMIYIPCSHEDILICFPLKSQIQGSFLQHDQKSQLKEADKDTWLVSQLVVQVLILEVFRIEERYEILLKEDIMSKFCLRLSTKLKLTFTM